MELTTQQKAAVKAIENFIDDKLSSVFILKGYAGTGKTTIVNTLLSVLNFKHKHSFLMAPTGRAAKVLRDKTNYPACTIHHGIYALEEMQIKIHDNEKEDDEEITDTIHFGFKIRNHEVDYRPSENVYIIDEASMISSNKNIGEELHFGSGILLDDLLEFVSPNEGGKVIFIGDPAQLLPVGDNKSNALNEEYFKEKGLGVSSFQLTEVLRQGGESIILGNAMKIRNLLSIDKIKRNELIFDRKHGEVEDIQSYLIAEKYCNKFPKPNIGDSAVICFTNSRVKEYNDAIRQKYFPNNNGPVEGDILMIVKNIINENLNIEFFNGDFVFLKHISPNVETISAPVYADVHGKHERINVSLKFRDVIVQSEDGKEVKCKMVEDTLNSTAPALTTLQNVALYISFKIRNKGIREGSQIFNEALKKDPYINAIQVKYGYAITGHKSQGGEWDTVFVDYSGKTGLNDDSLRWCYTTTTRATNIMYGVNMPSITPLSNLKFSTINLSKKPEKGAFSYADVMNVQGLPCDAKSFQKQKYLSVKRGIDEKGFVISNVRMCNYNDQYVFDTPHGKITYSCFYNASLMYTNYCTDSNLPETAEIDKILRNEDDMEYQVDYTPSSEFMIQLYNKMMSLCDDLSIKVTNIIEHTQQYYVTYYLKTSARFAQLKFYFKSNGTFSNIMPSSELGENDELLSKLIDRLK